jgi:hypothetical protein
MDLQPDEQMSAFNILSITGDFIGRLVAVCGVYVVALVLNKYKILTYTGLRDMFFIGLIGWDVVAIVCTVTIRKRYFLPPQAAVDATVESRLEIARKSGSVSERYVESVAVENGEFINANMPTSGDESFAEPADADTPLLTGLIDDPGPTPTMNSLENLNPWQYLVFCVKSFVYNRLLLLSMVHLWMVTTLLAFVTIVLRFDVTTQGTDVTNPTRENFCGSLLINLIETQLAGEVCRLIGAVLYQGYMAQISPYHFYKAVYLIYAVINAIMLTAVVFPLGPSLGSVVLGIITVFIYLSMIYSANLSSVVMDSSMAGFVFGVQGSGVQILALLPVATAAITGKLKIPTAFVTGYCVMHSIWSGCFSLYFALSSKKGLEALNDGKPSKSKCKRCLLGY